MEARGLEPPDLLTASQALYQLSYAPGYECRAYQPSEGRDVPPPVPQANAGTVHGGAPVTRR